MNDEQKAAYIYSQSICALIDMEAMKAANAYRERRGEAQAYGEKEFGDLILRYNIHHNGVMALFHNL